MKEIFKIYNSICVFYKNKGFLLKKLLSFFTTKPLIEDSRDDLLYKKQKILQRIIQYLLCTLYFSLLFTSRVENTCIFR